MAKKIESTTTKIQLFITIISVAVAIVNFAIAARLAPVVQDLGDLRAEVKADEAQIISHDTKFVSTTTFNGLVDRINHISSRVDSIYNILATHSK